MRMELVLLTMYALALRDIRDRNVIGLVSMSSSTFLYVCSHYSISIWTAVYQDCDKNPCLNGGECRLHAGSYTCSCSKPFSGYFCQDQGLCTVLCSVVTT